MVDIVNLVNDLSPYGYVELVGQNNEKGYVVVMFDVTTDLETLNTITTTYISTDFPEIVSETLVDGVYKLNRSHIIIE